MATSRTPCADAKKRLHRTPSVRALHNRCCITAEFTPRSRTRSNKINNLQSLPLHCGLRHYAAVFHRFSLLTDISLPKGNYFSYVRRVRLYEGLLLHAGNDHLAKPGAAYLVCALHQTGKIVGHLLVGNRLPHAADQQIRRLTPTHMTQHHCGRKYQ